MSIIERPCPGKDGSPRARPAAAGRKTARRIVGILLLSVWLAACATAPYQEMSDARQALESAQDAVGQMPGPRSKVRRAETLLDQARDHLGEREYDAARRLAERAKVLAIEARESAERPGS